jgi:hypothetical protein
MKSGHGGEHGIESEGDEMALGDRIWKPIVYLYQLIPTIMERALCGSRQIFADKGQERPYRPPATSPNSPKSGHHEVVQADLGRKRNTVS